MSRSGRVGWAQQKMQFGQNSAPIQRIFDLTDVFFRAACQTRSGGRKYPSRPKTVLLTPIRFYVGVFFLPSYIYELLSFFNIIMILCIIYERRKKRPTKKVIYRFRPPETNVAFGQGGLARPTNDIWQTFSSHPS